MAQLKSSDDDEGDKSDDSRASRRVSKKEIVANLEGLNLSPTSGQDPSSSGGEISVRYSERESLRRKNPQYSKPTEEDALMNKFSHATG